LALAFVVVSSQADAELFKNFKFDGSMEIDATAARNILDFNTATADRIGATQTRVMLGLDWDLLENAHSKVSIYKNDQVYGQYNGTTNGDASGAQNLNAIQSNVYVSQAYFNINKVFRFMDATFGRQYYGDPGDLIAYYGPKYDQYGMNVTSIDGAKFSWNGENAYATGLFFRPANTANAIANNGGTLSGQQDIIALVAGNKGNENWRGDISLWSQQTHLAQAAANPTVDAANDNLYVADVKIKGRAEGAYASVEIAHDFGNNRQPVANGQQFAGRYDGKALLADLGYKAEIKQIVTINPWAELGWGSGNGTTNPGHHNEDFQSIATDYRPGALYGRFDKTAALKIADDGTGAVSSNGLTNRKLWGLGVKATPKALNQLTAGIAFWDFNLYKLVDNSMFITTNKNYNDNAAGNRHLGSEVDLTGEWKHSENISFVGTFGDFQAGGLIKNLAGSEGSGNNPALMAALDVTVKF
jgi:hypothetical protein